MEAKKNPKKTKSIIILESLVYLMVFSVLSYLGYAVFSHEFVSSKQIECPIVDDIYYKAVLGSQDEKIPKLIGNYGDIGELESDEFAWTWNNEREGYYLLRKHIDLPKYYLSDNNTGFESQWILKGQNELLLDCSNLSEANIIAGSSYRCDLSYNDSIVSKGVRFTGSCDDWDKQTNCFGTSAFTVYSDPYGEISSDEYILVFTYMSGSKDNVSVYRLNSGQYEKLLFHMPDGSVEEELFISTEAASLNGEYTNWENRMNFADRLELVTKFHEPSMGVDSNVESIYTIWDVKEDGLYFNHRVIDLYSEEEQLHWL